MQFDRYVPRERPTAAPLTHHSIVEFAGAIGALAVMTVLSAAIGFALPNLLPREYTHYAAIALFLYFGVRMLKDSTGMESGCRHSQRVTNMKMISQLFTLCKEAPASCITSN